MKTLGSRKPLVFRTLCVLLTFVLLIGLSPEGDLSAEAAQRVVYASLYPSTAEVELFGGSLYVKSKGSGIYSNNSVIKNSGLLTIEADNIGVFAGNTISSVGLLDVSGKTFALDAMNDIYLQGSTLKLTCETATA